jgi:hypothetical protein
VAHLQLPLIGDAEVAAMWPDALPVDAARSALVDTRAVVTAIRAGRLRGYGVDDHLPGAETFADLAAEGRILQTGHSAWWRDEVLERGARWPRWWTQIAPEQSAMTWLQSVLLVVASAGAAMIAIADRSRSRMWLVLAVGFGGLALDERFTIHERVRDTLLAPRHVAVPFLPWVAPGDFLLLAYGVVGLTLLPSVIAVFRPDRPATRALILGVLFASVAAGVDSINPATWTIGQERIQQSLEECIELASDLSLLAAILLRLTCYLPGPQDTGHHPAGDLTVARNDDLKITTARPAEAAIHGGRRPRG